MGACKIAAGALKRYDIYMLEMIIFDLRIQFLRITTMRDR